MAKGKLGEFTLPETLRVSARTETARQALIERILTERARQFDLPGAEYDLKNGPNDYAAIASHYLGEEVRRGGRRPDRDAYENALVKAAAVILAALENAEVMQRNGQLG